MASAVLLAVGLLLLHTVQLSRSVHIIYDEVLWTKQNWEEYKIDPGIWGHLNPSEEVLSDPDLLSIVRRTKLNSLDGPEPRRTASAPLCVTARALRIADAVFAAGAAARWLRGPT